MGDACRALDFPIVSGNVSLYNESKATGGGSAILPTPAIGGVGLLDDWSKSATIGFKNEGEDILLIGTDEADVQPSPHLGQSLWLREIVGQFGGEPPAVDLQLEKETGTLIRELVAKSLVSAVHDVSDGGPLVAIAEMALAGNIGAAVGLSSDDLRTETLSMFAENQGMYLVSAPREKFDDVDTLCFSAGIECVPIGRVGGRAIDIVEVPIKGPEKPIASIPLADLRAAHEGFFPALMQGEL
jgi:phosphoribosylformylglycinamidine synthase subunit PurL